MAYVVGGIAGIVWFWFWIRGNWFSALLAAVGTGWIPLIDDKWRNEWQLCLAVLVVPWVPIVAGMAYRRLARDLRVIAGKDAEFAEPLSLEVRELR
jgi:hypothetical protein